VDWLPGAQCPATGGYLHNPGHQADIWYISVYTPSQALGDFVLTGGVLGAQPNGFDGIGGSAVVSDQLAGQWKFFRIDVPTDAVGWDIRLAGVSEGNPNFVVCRNSLPTELSADPWPSWGYYGCPWTSSAWPSGWRWQSGSDWTECGGGPMLAMSMGNPLEAGTYYVGVLDPNNPSSYTIQSRGIGLTNYTIQMRDLDFVGSTTNLSLNVGEGDYYRVVVPSNAPDWKLKLQALSGDVLLKV
jgi:hypothetical protein